jgi:hypothetical protein
MDIQTCPTNGEVGPSRTPLGTSFPACLWLPERPLMVVSPQMGASRIERSERSYKARFRDRLTRKLYVCGSPTVTR